MEVEITRVDCIFLYCFLAHLYKYAERAFALALVSVLGLVAVALAKC